MHWDITHCCDHTESYLIVASFAYRAETRALQLKRRKCMTCYRANKDAKAGDQATADDATLAALDLPSLTGSERQVAWAEKIRRERLAAPGLLSGPSADVGKRGRPSKVSSIITSRTTRSASRLPALSPSAITIMAVMLLAVSGNGASGFRPVSVRLVQRFIDCIAGGALAAATLFAAHGSPLVLVTGTAIGVVIGRHLENGEHGYRYVGTQFRLALLITLVPDSYADAKIAPALAHLSCILIGMAVLEPVLLTWHLLNPSRTATATQAAASEPGGL